MFVMALILLFMGGSVTPVFWLNDAPQTFRVAGKRSRREISEIIHRVPAGLDAAHVGYNFINVLGRVHYGSLAQLPNDD
jgi:hypothetical protein